MDNRQGNYEYVRGDLLMIDCCVGAHFHIFGALIVRYHVEGTPEGLQCGGSLRESVPKQLRVSLPIIFARAVQVQQL